MDFCYKLSIFGHECNFDSNVRYDMGLSTSQLSISYIFLSNTDDILYVPDKFQKGPIFTFQEKQTQIPVVTYYPKIHHYEETSWPMETKFSIHITACYNTH